MQNFRELPSYLSLVHELFRFKKRNASIRTSKYRDFKALFHIFNYEPDF